MSYQDRYAPRRRNVLLYEEQDEWLEETARQLWTRKDKTSVSSVLRDMVELFRDDPALLQRLRKPNA